MKMEIEFFQALLKKSLEESGLEVTDEQSEMYALIFVNSCKLLGINLQRISRKEKIDVCFFIACVFLVGVFVGMFIISKI